MSTGTGRPAQKKQTSRKGKKAWRKNIDIEDVEQGIEDMRDAEIVLGNGPLFEVDTQGGDENLTNAMKAEKKLKSLEILSNRSAVPALSSVHKKKEKAKSKPKKIHDLVRLTGRTGENVANVRLERDGVVKNGSSDIWGAEEVPEPAVKRPKSQSMDAPEPALPGTKAVEVPVAGKSYNPLLEDWKKLIAAENAREEKAEAERLAAEEEKERIEAILAAAANENSDEEDVESSDEEVDINDGLSVNAPVKNKKKTQQQRNKQKRHQERERMHLRLKQLRRQLHELQKPQQETVVSGRVEKKPKKAKMLKKAHGKYAVMEQPLEVKLSDELDDSLRRLKPEGSVAHDRFRSLQARGLIEARVPYKHKQRKHSKKSTEKWSYKDIKL